MAYQYWRNVGAEGKDRFIGFSGGYHGDTIGAMSAGGSSTFWQNFKRLMFDIDVVDFPETWEDDDAADLKEQRSLRQLKKLLEKTPDGYAGIIIEPLVQGAAGMKMCRPSFLKALRRLADEFSTLLIFDEVMTGFGRTGDWFACTKTGVSPDIIMISKGITGGFMPLALTIATEDIYSAFLSDDSSKAFYHSHSYTGNPLACAAALASLDLLQSNPAFTSMEQMHRANAQEYLHNCANVSRLRFCGTIAAFDLDAGGGRSDYFSDLGPHLRSLFLAENLLLRPLGNVIYFMPPYCTDKRLLDTIYKKVRQVITNLNSQ
jgi:adenosylmethionine-8-amino-7-oxononanoate aminotransferase